MTQQFNNDKLSQWLEIQTQSIRLDNRKKDGEKVQSNSHNHKYLSCKQLYSFSLFVEALVNIPYAKAGQERQDWIKSVSRVIILALRLHCFQAVF